MSNFDELEVRSEDERETDLFSRLRDVLTKTIAKSPSYADRFKGVDVKDITDRTALSRLPILRKSEIGELQAVNLPLGGLNTVPLREFANVFQSPGPIYEAVMASSQGGRVERFLHAVGLDSNDVVHNCFSYHFTPAGLMFDRAAGALGAVVFPAGIGQTELQVEAAKAIGSTAYIGTPDYLLTILQKAEEKGIDLKFDKAGVTGGALFPSLRQEYLSRNITCMQCYATAELGLIAYETTGADGVYEGMVVDENLILEIVRPGTGDPTAIGEVGEVVVTLLKTDLPLIRFATGDLSAILKGQSPCGRTNMRIKGWMGRADQATKVKGMFVRPEQIAAFLHAHPEVARAKAVVTRSDEGDHMKIFCETDGADVEALKMGIKSTVKLNAEVELIPLGALPNDGLVIDDQREYE